MHVAFYRLFCFLKYCHWILLSRRKMAVSVESLQRFLSILVFLPSFPVCCGYLVMIICLAPIWQRKTSPLQIRPVSLLNRLFVCGVFFLSHLRFFHSYGVVIMTSERLQIFTFSEFSRHSFVSPVKKCMAIDHYLF